MKTNLLDRLIGPDGRFKIPWWIWIPAGWVLTGLVLQSTKWIDGSAVFPEVTRGPAVEPFYVVAPLAGYALLARAGRTAFDRFRPALAVGADEADGWRHRMSTVRPIVAWTSWAVGGLIGSVATLSDPTTNEELTTSILTAVVWTFFNFVSFGLHFVVGALVISQIRNVARLHRQAAKIDLFRPDPLHAFASLTARAGIVVVGLIMYSVLTDPATLENQTYIGIAFGGFLLAAATFALPLTGMRNRLRQEKHRLRGELAERLSALTSELHEAIDARRLDDVGNLKTALDVLATEQQRIDKTSTWPWETATVRGFVTTLLLPVATWLVTAVLSRTLSL